MLIPFRDLIQYNIFMSLSLLTYNILFNNAADKIDEIIDKYHPDIVCLQEVLTNEGNLKKIEMYGYKLADYSNSFIKFSGKIFGVATFYNPDRLSFVQSISLKLGNNLLEVFFTLIQIIIGYNKPKTILRCDFVDKVSKKKLTICNTHLYVVAPNNLRVNHLNQALKSLSLDNQSALIIAGDFNYFPYQRKRLENLMKKYHLQEATKNIRQTFKLVYKGIFDNFNLLQKVGLYILKTFKLTDKITNQFKNDYIFYRGLRLKRTERIETQCSDHYPIISTFEI